jgi:hypothetical protein
VLNLDHRPGFLLESLPAAFRVANQDFDRGKSWRIELTAAIDLALPTVPEFVEKEELIQSQIAAKQIEFIIVESRLNDIALVFRQAGWGG